MYCGTKRAFTLVELIISITLSGMIILIAFSAYFLITKIKSSMEATRQKEELMEFILTLQRGLYTGRDIKVGEGNKGSVLSYITNYGLSHPYVKVRVSFQRGYIVYEEFIPFGEVLLFRKNIPVDCSIKREDIYIYLNCKELKISIPFNKLKRKKLFP